MFLHFEVAAASLHGRIVVATVEKLQRDRDDRGAGSALRSCSASIAGNEGPASARHQSMLIIDDGSLVEGVIDPAFRCDITPGVRRLDVVDFKTAREFEGSTQRPCAGEGSIQESVGAA